MKKESKDFIRGASWAIRRFESKLPFGGSGCRQHSCDCSADAVYYLEDMKNILNRNLYKSKRKGGGER